MKAEDKLPVNLSVASQTGYMLLTIGNLLNSLPDFKGHKHLRSGDLLIRIGRKLASSCIE